MIWNKTFINPILIAITVITIIFIPVNAYLNSLENETIFEITQFKVFESSSYNELREEVNTDHMEFNLGFKKEAFLGFNLNEVFKSSDNIIIEIKNPTFREVYLYNRNANENIELIGTAGTKFGRTNTFLNPNPIFHLNKQEHGNTDFFVKFVSVEPINFKLTATPELVFTSNYNKRLIFVSVYIGIIFALFLYNFILFFLIRDIIYFYYSIYIFFIGLAQLSLLGYSFYYFLGQSVVLYETSIIGFSSFAGIFGISFLRIFLKTRVFTPLIDKFLFLNMLLYMIAFLLRVFDFIQLSYSLTDFSGLMVVVLFLFAGVTIAKKGQRSAIYFLLAWSMFFVGLVLFILQNHGLIKIESAANLPMLVGTALEAILLSLALADRINILKKEKEMEQVEKLEILHQNELLILRQNEMLEEKVKMRTEELEETLHDLQNTQIQLINQEKMASLGQLTAGIAHEINNPINFVSSNINPLKRDINDVLEIVEAYRESGLKEFSEETKKKLLTLEDDLEFEYVLQEIEQLLRGMEDGAKRTVEIVKGLRLFSRVDEQDVKKVNIHDGIDSTIVLLNNTMNGQIKIQKEYGDLPLVECLAGKMNQVFMNIITNSIHALQDDFNKEKEPTITIKTSSDGERVRLEIKDNGPGIPENVKQRIFEPFFTTKSVGKGTGLGLSIVYTIIENHKGNLEVISEEDKGTSFIITLPIAQSNNDERQQD